MKGLLIKDWKLLKNQGRFYAVIVLFALVVMAASESGYTFAGYYLTFLASLFTLSTFSYDEENGGTGFLMTLPADRKTYVKEKFLFGILLTGGSWLVSCLLSAVFLMLRKPGENPLSLIPPMLGFLAVFLLLLFAAIPMILRFGPEKGRLGLVGMIGIFTLLLIIISRTAGSADAAVESLKLVLARYTAASVSVAVILYLAVIQACYRISVRIMEKREF